MTLSSSEVVFLLHYLLSVCLPMRSNYVHILLNCCFFCLGGVEWDGWGDVENYRLRLNSAKFQLK